MGLLPFTLHVHKGLQHKKNIKLSPRFFCTNIFRKLIVFLTAKDNLQVNLVPSDH